MLRKITAVVIIISSVSLALWDVIVLLLMGPDSTISVVILEWSHRYPVLPFLFGFIAGHVFWPVEKKH